MGKLVEFHAIDEFVVPSKIKGKLNFVEVREPHKVDSRLIPKWCKGVVIHRPTHLEDPDGWEVSDVVTHMKIDIKHSKEMKEAILRVSAELRRRGEAEYLSSINRVKTLWFPELVDDPRFGYNLLNSNNGG